MFDRRRSPLTTALSAGPGSWYLAGGLLLELVACSIALVGLVQGAGWWFALIGTAVLLLAIPAALRSVGVASWAATLIDVLVLGILIQLVFASGSGILGVIPSRASIAGLGELFRRALVAIEVQHIPAEPLPELIFFIVLLGGALTIVLDVLAVVLRVPALTALVIGGVMVVPAILQPNGLTLTALGAGAAAWLVVLKLDGRLRFGTRGGNGVALAAGASATLIALVVAATAPGFIETGRTPIAAPMSVGNGVDPLINLGADLRRPNSVEVLTYTSDAKTPQYLQLTTLDQIHGADWTHTPGAVAPLQSGAGLAGAPGLSAGAHISAKRVTTSISVQNLRSTWLPVPYPSTKVKGASGLQGYQRNDLTVFARGGDLSGQRYTVSSLDLEPTEQQLAAQSQFPSSAAFAPVRSDLVLPKDVPQIITDTANTIAAQAGGTSEFDLAVAIQDYFQNSLNGFSYSTDTPDSSDGASLSIIAKFLQVKEGYCVHYASAMAVLARVLGIPSRIAVGYLPGTPVGTQGDVTSYQVDSSELHAWPQLYFPNVGWLNFEPTVGRGAAPLYTVTTSPDSQPTTAPAQSTAPSSAPSSTPTAAGLPTEQAASTGNTVAAHNGVPLDLGILIALALLAGPAIGRALRRRGRLTRLRDDGVPPTLAWDEVRDTARDLGFAAPPTETPRAFAARLRSDWHPDAAHRRDLDDILEQLELSEYGPPRAWERYFELADKTVSVTAAMRASRPWHVRLRATLIPLSLFTPPGGREGQRARTL